MTFIYIYDANLTTIVSVSGIQRNTNTTKSGNVYATRLGKLISVGGWLIPTDDRPPLATDIIATGFPQAAQNTTIPLYDQTYHKTGAYYIEDGSTNIIVGSGYDVNYSGCILNLYGFYLAR